MRGPSNRGITYDRIYSMVRRIPKGRVATYGQIACLAGIPRQARQIGYALAALRDHHPVPWHRVVNSKGEISQRSEPGFEERQRILLESEGVVFDVNGRISLSRFRWRRKMRCAIQRKCGTTTYALPTEPTRQKELHTPCTIYWEGTRLRTSKLGRA